MLGAAVLKLCTLVALPLRLWIALNDGAGMPVGLHMPYSVCCLPRLSCYPVLTMAVKLIIVVVLPLLVVHLEFHAVS